MLGKAAPAVGALLRIAGAGVCVAVAASLVESLLQLAEWWVRSESVQLVAPTRTWFVAVGLWTLVKLAALGAGIALHALGKRFHPAHRSPPR